MASRERRSRLRVSVLGGRRGIPASRVRSSKDRQRRERRRQHFFFPAGDSGADGANDARSIASSSPSPGLPRRAPARPALLLVRSAGRLGQVQRDLDAGVLQGLVRQVPFPFPFPAGDSGADGAVDARSDAAADHAVADDARSNAPTDHAVADDARSDAPVADDARSNTPADHAVADGAPGDDKARANAFSSITTGLPRRPPARSPLLLVRAAGRLGQVRRDLDARVLQALVRQVLRRRRRLFAGRRRPGGTWEENREGDSRFFLQLSRHEQERRVPPFLSDLFSPHHPPTTVPVAGCHPRAQERAQTLRLIVERA